MAATVGSALKFHFGPLLVARYKLRLRVMDAASGSRSAPADGSRPDMRMLEPGEHGFLLRSLPVPDRLPEYTVSRDAIRYVPRQFDRCFIDLSGDYNTYLSGFSSKKRSTLQRKVRKFFELPGGAEFRSYRSPEELQAFHTAARGVSALTYQERLYAAGLPDAAEFVAEMLRLAAADNVRAYALFLDGAPVSYLYCPVDRGRLIYGYLGFDPEHAKHSPGTVLQMLALSDIFEEKRFTIFDFTEGDGEHKRLFSTRCVPSADIYFFKRNMINRGLVLSHLALERASNKSVRLAEKLGLKRLLRKKLRRQA